MTTSHDITVLAGGLMGSALARTLAAGGKTVAGWNRTHHRAEVLADDAIAPLQDSVEAVKAAPLGLACVATYDDAIATLESVSPFASATLIDLGIGASAEVESFGEIVEVL